MLKLKIDPGLGVLSYFLYENNKNMFTSMTKDIQKSTKGCRICLGVTENYSENPPTEQSQIVRKVILIKVLGLP